MDTHKYREEMKTAFEGNEGFSVRDSNTLGKKLIYYALPIDKRTGYVTRVSIEAKEADKEVKSFKISIILILMIFNIIVFLVFMKIKNHYLEKFNTVKRILENDQFIGIYIEEEIELKPFWNFLKLWKDKKNEINQRLEEEKDKLKEVMSAIDISIIAVRLDGRIMMLNSEAEGTFVDTGYDTENNDYHIRIKYIELIKYINRIQLNFENSKEELYIASTKKYYIVETKYLESRSIFIISLKDITKEKELSDIHKRFITNISHELKTPLTNIKGYMVAIEEEKDEVMRQTFINTINKNIAKIEKMVFDFLDISKAENSRVLNIYPVSVLKILDEVSEELKGLIGVKNARIKHSINLMGEYNYIKVDYEKVVLILKNLVENSIVYNDKEIPEVIIEISEKEKEYFFGVKDNGMGIPEDELEKVFEKFYRVDKARSGNIVGTGLGLSIVKEVAKIHNGYINISSKLGVGTEVSLYIKK